MQYIIFALCCVCVRGNRSFTVHFHPPNLIKAFRLSEKCNSIAAARSARCFERWIMLLTQSTFTIHQYGEMEMQRMPIYIARCIGIFTREMKCTLHARLQSLFNRTMQIFNILWHFTPTRLTFLVKRKLTIANRARASRIYHGTLADCRDNSQILFKCLTCGVELLRAARWFVFNAENASILYLYVCWCGLAY